MKLLLDTHILIWAAFTPARLSTATQSLLMDVGNELFFSPVNLWEVAIKRALGRRDFQFDSRILRRSLLQNDYQELPVTSDHAVAINQLPGIHKDPFDRLLIAQSTVEGILLLTADPTVAQYPAPVKLV
ncbi:MAG: type II toxin-antitoxin system VapC family toxin [Bryobacteraceae bacterium]|nr:type II toxin-antitoxin system VapC family toxin [Bryobacteraceae bacterium]